jgi:hypothetical protein
MWLTLIGNNDSKSTAIPLCIFKYMILYFKKASDVCHLSESFAIGRCKGLQALLVSKSPCPDAGVIATLLDSDIHHIYTLCYTRYTEAPRFFNQFSNNYLKKWWGMYRANHSLSSSERNPYGEKLSLFDSAL